MPLSRPLRCRNRIVALGAAALTIVGTAGLAEGHKVVYDSNVTIAYGSGAMPNYFTGKVKSPQKACRPHRKVRLFHQQAGPDVLVRSTTTNANGSWSTRDDAPDGNYYATAKRSDIGPGSHNHLCRGARSDTIHEAPVPQSYTVGGTVSGLSGDGLKLTNNGGDELAISGNGAFNFSSPIPSAGTYSVTVSVQPSGPQQLCAVANANGTVTDHAVTDIEVSCVNAYTVGGSVTGLGTSSGLAFENNGADSLPVVADGPFTFSIPVADGQAYSVTVQAQPFAPSQSCIVGNGNGTVSGANVTNVSVTCTINSYTVGGTVSGLVGTGLKLKNNSGDEIARNSNGGFTFPTSIDSGQGYNVTVSAQPTNPSQTCAVANGSGTVGNGNVTNVSTACTGTAINGTAAAVDFCAIQYPDSATVQAGSTLTVYGQIYEPGVTNVSTSFNPSVRAQLGIVATNTDPAVNLAGWQFAAAGPNYAFDQASNPNNDEYQGNLTVSTPGSYEYAFRFSLDNGATWTYCDQNQAYTSSPALGQLTVTS